MDWSLFGRAFNSFHETKSSKMTSSLDLRCVTATLFFLSWLFFYNTAKLGGERES